MIVSIQEARKILGDEAKDMTDLQVQQLIEDLDVIALYSLQEAVNKRKKDATRLASLIYDAYKGNKD